MKWVVHLENGPRRVNHAAVAIGDLVYSFGGYWSGDDYKCTKTIDVNVLDTNTFRWHRLTSTTSPCSSRPSSRTCTSPTYDSGYMSGDGSDSDDGTLRVDRGFGGSAPYQRYGHTVVAYSGKAYVWGGRNDEKGASSKLHEYDPAENTWRVVDTRGKIPPARDGHSAVVVDDNMYIFGGFEEEFQRFSNETYCYNFTTAQWSEIVTKGTPPIFRDFHTAAVINNNMYVFGGRGDYMGQFHSNRDFYCDKLKVLNLATSEWSEPNVSGDVPTGRRSHSAWTYNDKMYIFGGFYSVGDKHYNELFEFDPATNRWTQIRAHGLCPTPRRRQCTVALGHRIFLFGGTSPCRKVGNENYSYNTGLQDLDDLHILDFSPSLFTLSAVRVIDLNFHKSYAHYLPATINKTLIDMTTTNKASIPPSRFDLQG
ncbi:hypothetical protein QR680_006118 [Steinernema hermaphroditum]|uniref:Kelch domain-containing protein 3 n=1 Tax=Steinernema hermaphroditum TaxID=289476 RepID=A0AA39HVH4_9BILA|nr:hypothetical protein QR680_006118 [Steinernema hermaphroditum]